MLEIVRGSRCKWQHCRKKHDRDDSRNTNGDIMVLDFIDMKEGFDNSI
jgi:hypothetical protein